MKIEINSKYNIGNLVQKYKIVGEYKDKIVCPLCNGKHFVDNPNYDPHDYDDDEDDKLECPHCNQDGYIETNYVTNRVLDQEIYRVESIDVYINKDGSVKYAYRIESTPELNNRADTYCSHYAVEEDLELLKTY